PAPPSSQIPPTHDPPFANPGLKERHRIQPTPGFSTPFTKTCKDLLPHPFPRALRGRSGALQSEFANKLPRVEVRTVECVPVDIECGRPLFALIDGHYKCQGLRILVDIHFFEVHALLPQKVPGCARVFAAHPGIHSDMFRFQRSTSFRAGVKCRNCLSANERRFLHAVPTVSQDSLTSRERSIRLLRLQKLCPAAVPSPESVRQSKSDAAS